nr:hypothetical protein [Rhodothermus marinus]
MEPLRLHPDRYFDPDPTVRRIARELYEEMRTFRWCVRTAMWIRPFWRRTSPSRNRRR